MPGYVTRVHFRRKSGTSFQLCFFSAGSVLEPRGAQAAPREGARAPTAARDAATAAAATAVGPPPHPGRPPDGAEDVHPRERRPPGPVEGPLHQKEDLVHLRQRAQEAVVVVATAGGRGGGGVRRADARPPCEPPRAPPHGPADDEGPPVRDHGLNRGPVAWSRTPRKSFYCSQTSNSSRSAAPRLCLLSLHPPPPPHSLLFSVEAFKKRRILRNLAFGEASKAGVEDNQFLVFLSYTVLPHYS